MKISILSVSLFLIALFACTANKANDTKILKIMEENKSIAKTVTGQLVDTAVFGAGCFWCVEAQFQLLKGVQEVQSGYMGGIKENPTYQEVCTGTTQHAEVLRVIYNPQEISFDKLLQAFFMAHDPTQLNRQGNDIGTQYRSVIFYNSEEQKEKSLYYIDQLNAAKVFNAPIVTAVDPIAVFYPAEAYHDNYYNLNKEQSYCNFVIKPKVEYFKEVFKDVLK